MAPLISIVIPLYNKASCIGRTIDSILRQTYDNYEIVIVNDGSTDNGLEIVSKFTAPRIKIINQENAGVSVARNCGVKESVGRYIAFLDADDEWKEDYLQSQVDLIRDYPECDVFATAYEFKDEYKRITQAVYRGIKFPGQSGILDNYFEVAAMSNPPVWTSAVVIRKECLETIGGFMPGVATGEDLLVWAKLAVRYKIAFNKTPQAIYNLPSGGTLRKDPKDMSMKNDIVRTELIKLYENSPSGYLRIYLSFWDKMRAAINIKKSDCAEGRKYAMMAIRWNKWNYKAIILFFISFMPTIITKKLIK